MRNILYNEDSGLNLPRDVQLKRIRQVMANELTDLQRETLMLYYFEELCPAEIARRQGVHRSSALRTLRRAENRLRRFLKY